MATSDLYVVIVEFSLKPYASRAESKKLLVQNAIASFQNETGCHRFDVVETNDAEVPFVLYEIYQDETAFSDHLKSKHYLEFEAASEQYFEEKKVRLNGLVSEASSAMEILGKEMSKMMDNSLAEMTRSRSSKFGHYVGEFVTPGIGHILASAQCDFVFFDMEHSGFGVETLKSAVRYFEAASIPVIVRSPSKDYDVIARICDAGAEGIMAPMIKDAAEAANVVQHIKYPPVGKRGVALGIAHDNFLTGGVPVAERLEHANKRTTFFALIETREGAENADEIAATPGVDCLWVGHFDLTASLGIAGKFDHPDYLAALDRIIQAAKKYDLSLGRLVGSPAEGLSDLKQGFDFCCYATDSSLYQKALIDGISELRCAANGK